MQIVDFMYAYIIVLIGVCGLLIYLYSTYIEKYNMAIQIFGVLSTISMPFVFALTGVTAYNATRLESVHAYGNNVDKFMNDIFEKFLNTPHMMYMYNEMMGTPNKKNIVRDIDMEVVVGCYIFANCAKVCGYIYEAPNEADAQRIKGWLTKVLIQYIESPILASVWTNHYKPKLAGPLLMRFMKETFNI